jgi:hypothetical protein
LEKFAATHRAFEELKGPMEKIEDAVGYKFKFEIEKATMSDES